MMFVQRPAITALASDANKSRTSCARWINLMQHEGAWRIADSETCTAQTLRQFRLFFMACRTGAKPRVEQPNGSQGRTAEGHVRTQYTTNFHHLLAMIDDRQIEIGCCGT